MSDKYPVLCGKCHVSPERGFEREGQIWAACPVCGQEDTIEDIQREAGEYFTDRGLRILFTGLKSDVVGVKCPPEREYRWITGD
jgi:hypothetical protein